MNPADAFVLAIAQSPEDDSLRLMFADWLEDQGDPRGELIRVQCALARAGPDLERTELKNRERQLLPEHSAEGAPPPSGPADHCRVRRGFAEVDLDLPALLSRADWQPSPLVLRVRLSDSHTTATGLASLARSPALAAVTALELRRPAAPVGEVLRTL